MPGQNTATYFVVVTYAPITFMGKQGLPECGTLPRVLRWKKQSVDAKTAENHQSFARHALWRFVCLSACVTRTAMLWDHATTTSWHAGPTGHLLVSDMLFMHYAEVFLSALERLDAVRPGITAAGLQHQDALSTGGRSSLRESLGLGEVDDNGSGSGSGSNSSGSGGSGSAAAYMGGGRGAILPPPAWCKGWRFCDWAGNYRCADTYFPLAGKEGSRLLDMVSERTPAVLNRNHSEHFVEPAIGRWVVTLNEEARSIKDYLLVPPPEGFHHPIDMKW